MEAAGKVTSVRFLRVNRLIDDLRRERVDHNLSYKYLLGLMIVHNLSIATNASGLAASLYFVAVWAAVLVILTVIEVRTCYMTNKANDNRDFIKRYIAISFIVDLMMFIAVLICGAILTVALTAALEPVFTQIEVDLATGLPIVGISVIALLKVIVILWKWKLFAKVSKPMAV